MYHEFKHKVIFKVNISIAMATFNGARYISEQLFSLAQQELLPYELVAVDDGSSDATVTQLYHFAETAPFSVRIYHNNSRLGYGMNFLRAAGLCEGDAIAFCDQDDFWMPSKLRLVAAAITDLQADFVVHSADVTDSYLNLTGHRYPDICAAGFWDTHHISSVFYPGFAITISQKFYSKIHRILRQKRIAIEAHDELICEMAYTGWKRCELSESLVQYRQHNGNLIGYHGALPKMSFA